MPSLSRRRVITAAGVLLAGLLILSFARQVGEATAASNRAAELRATNAALRDEVGTAAARPRARPATCASSASRAAPSASAARGRSHSRSPPAPGPRRRRAGLGIRAPRRHPATRERRSMPGWRSCSARAVSRRRLGLSAPDRRHESARAGRLDARPPSRLALRPSPRVVCSRSAGATRYGGLGRAELGAGARDSGRRAARCRPSRSRSRISSSSSAALVGGVLLLITVLFDDILGGILDGFGFDFSIGGVVAHAIAAGVRRHVRGRRPVRDAGPRPARRAGRDRRRRSRASSGTPSRSACSGRSVERKAREPFSIGDLVGDDGLRERRHPGRTATARVLRQAPKARPTSSPRRASEDIPSGTHRPGHRHRRHGPHRRALMTDPSTPPLGGAERRSKGSPVPDIFQFIGGGVIAVCPAHHHRPRCSS